MRDEEYELINIERERSTGFINRIKDFLDSHDDNKTTIDFSTKKQLCWLLFKNIKICPAVGGARAQKRISFYFFEPFNFLFLETEKKLQCQTNQRLTKIPPAESALEPSAAR